MKTCQTLSCHHCSSLQWHHNEHDGISNHWHLDHLVNHLFRCRSKKTSKLCVTGLCEGNPPVTGGFPSQRSSNMENLVMSSYSYALYCLLLGYLQTMPDSNPLVALWICNLKHNCIPDNITQLLRIVNYFKRTCDKILHCPLFDCSNADLCRRAELGHHCVCWCPAALSHQEAYCLLRI